MRTFWAISCKRNEMRLARAFYSNIQPPVSYWSLGVHGRHRGLLMSWTSYTRSNYCSAFGPGQPSRKPCPWIKQRACTSAPKFQGSLLYMLRFGWLRAWDSARIHIHSCISGTAASAEDDQTRTGYSCYDIRTVRYRTSTVLCVPYDLDCRLCFGVGRWRLSDLVFFS